MRRMCLLLLVLLTGCAGNRVILHPISGQDIFRMKKDTAYTPVKDGYFLSDEYMKEVAQVKVRKITQ